VAPHPIALLDDIALNGRIVECPLGVAFFMCQMTIMRLSGERGEFRWAGCAAVNGRAPLDVVLTLVGWRCAPTGSRRMRVSLSSAPPGGISRRRGGRGNVGVKKPPRRAGGPAAALDGANSDAVNSPRELRVVASAASAPSSAPNSLKNGGLYGEPSGTRTQDPLLKRQVL
jgi:hypothetical protein